MRVGRFANVLAVAALAMCAVPACIGDEKPNAGMDGAAGASADCSNWLPTADRPCDPVSQCGCETNLNCIVVDVAKTHCVKAGSVPETAECASDLSTECQRGLQCVTSVCVKSCNAPADCPGDNRLCVAVQDRGSYCTTMCDLVSPGATCGLNVGCWPVGDPGNHTECSGNGKGQAGDPCGPQTARQDCGPGYVCGSVSQTTGQCFKWCKMANGIGDCPNGKLCACSGSACFTSALGVQYGTCPHP
jgi:hypothetical protein